MTDFTSHRPEIRRDPPTGGRPKARGISLPSLMGLGLLLVLPVLAILRLPAPNSWIAAAVGFVMSMVAVAATRSDKVKAQNGEWRTPEIVLHLLEALGGWPGAFLAQRRYRHKTRKIPYQFQFWMILLAYQAGAADFISDGWLSRTVFAWVNAHLR